MKFKSQLVTAISGAVGGLVGSHNQGGMYFRARAIPTDPQSSAQEAIRNAVTTLSNSWSGTLSQAQRDAWEVYAVNVPLTDVFGDSRTRSGEQHYIRSNVPRLQAGLDQVNDAPTVFTLGDFTAPTYSVTAAQDEVVVEFSDDDDWVGEDGSALLVYQSRPQSAGINFFKGPYRLGGNIEGDAGSPLSSPEAFTAPFPVEAGAKIFFRARVTRADGRLSGATVASVIAT